MVAAGMAGVYRAVEITEAIGEDRCAAVGECYGDAGEILGARHGEAARQRLLVGAQDVDRERRRGGELAQHLVAAVDGEQHQRRIERQRGDRVRGHAPLAAAGGAGGDHRHAGGEVAEDAPLGGAVNRHVPSAMPGPRSGQATRCSASNVFCRPSHGRSSATCRIRRSPPGARAGARCRWPHCR